MPDHTLKRKTDGAMGGTLKKRREGAKFDSGYDDEEADLVISSADGAMFRVHSFCLMAASPVFRTMIKDCTSHTPEIHLTDDELEASATLRILLDLVCDKPYRSLGRHDCFSVMKLIRLAQKWDFVTVLRIVSSHTTQAIRKGDDAQCLFFYACALDELKVAHRLLPEAASLTWGLPHGSPSVHANKQGASSLDPTGMSSSFIDILPRKYFLALLRAWNLRVQKHNASWQEVADEFKKQVKTQNKE